MRLDLELRLIDFLKKSGYEPIYKPHPDRLKEIEGIFEGRCKVIKSQVPGRLRNRYFRYLMDKMDTLLFMGITTTSFNFALCSSRPIVALDLSFKQYKPFAKPLELLKKRCSIVSTGFDERNRIIFNEKELLDALSRKPEQPNTEFIETYMFPERVKKKVKERIF